MPRTSVPSVLNGVGKQPPTVRRRDHFDDALNVQFDPESGATKRQGFAHEFYIPDSDMSESDVAVEWIDRDNDNRYLVVWSANQGRADSEAEATIPFKIYDLADGSEQTVGWGNGAGASDATNKAISDYLNYIDATIANGAASASNIVMITVADTTFILNKTVVTAFDTSDPNFVELNTGETLLDLKDAAQGTVLDYPDSDEYYWASRDDEADVNRAQLGLYLHDNTFSNELSAVSGLNNVAATPRWVETVNLLPDRYFGQTPAGAGVDDGTSPEYVQVKTSSAFGPLGWYKGTKTSNAWTWERFPPLDVDNCYIDATTMPVRLVREANGDFNLYQIEWTPRYNGDEETNLAPSFVGFTIEDMTFFQNRLCFLSGENFIASASGDFYNFFLNDYTNITDSDPIDIAASTNKVAEGQFFGLVKRNLYIFTKSDLQFEVQYSVETGLSPLTVSLVPVTSYTTSVDVRPASSGDALYFLSDRGVYTNMYEFFETTPQDTPTTAFNVSIHVADYLSESIEWMDGDGENQFIILGYPSGLYIYQYFWVNQTKIQEAWSRWALNSNDVIVSGKVYDDDLYILVRQDGIGDDEGEFFWHVLKCSLKVRTPESNMDYFPQLDFYTKITTGYTYNAGTDTTTIVISDLPDFVGTNWAVVYGPDADDGDDNDDGVWRPLGNPTIDTTAGTMTFTISGDITDRDFLYVGRKFSSELDFNPPFIYVSDGQSLVPRDIGTTQIVSLILNYQNTGYIKIKATHEGGQEYTEVLEPYTVGGFSLGTGPVIANGKHKFVIFGDNRKTNVKLINDTPLPFTIGSFEWELSYFEGETE